MKESKIRKWLAVYFLLISGILGFYFLIFGETPFLPIQKQFANSSFNIIIPIFISQLVLIFKWYTGSNINSNQPDRSYNIPVWLIKGPPIIVLCILVTTIVLYISFAQLKYIWKPSSETFQSIVAFCATLINASTIFIITSLFKTEQQQS